MGIVALEVVVELAMGLGKDLQGCIQRVGCTPLPI